MTRGRRGDILAALLSLAACLIAIEVGARIVVRIAARTPATLGILSRHDPLLGWAQPAGESAWLHEEEFSTHLEINSHGLRGPDHGHDKPDGARRALLLGDSFTNGYTVAEEETVRARLEALLGEPWQVLNAGVAGYSTDQEYLYYLDEGRRYAPDAVILMFFGNDLTGNVRERKKPWFERRDGALERRNVPVPLEGRPALRPVPEDRWADPWRGSVALEMLGRRTAAGRPDLHRSLASLGLVRPLEEHAPTRDWLSVYGPPTPEIDEMWDRTAALLGALDEAVREDGSRFGVFYVPARFEMSDSDWRLTRSRWGLNHPAYAAERPLQRLRDACAERGIALVDPRRALRAAIESQRRPYLERDPHWNAAGHAIAAEVLHQWLCDAGAADC